MMAETGCDGVVVGRGCLGRPWLFRDLADAFAGRPVQPPPPLGDGAPTSCVDHAERLAEWKGERDGMKAFRKHASWYLTGYPVGGAAAEAGRARGHARRPRRRPRPSSTPRSRSCPTRCGPPAATPTAPARSTCPRAGSTSSTTPPRPRAPSSSSAGG